MAKELKISDAVSINSAVKRYKIEIDRKTKEFYESQITTNDEYVLTVGKIVCSEIANAIHKEFPDAKKYIKAYCARSSNLPNVIIAVSFGEMLDNISDISVKYCKDEISKTTWMLFAEDKCVAYGARCTTIAQELIKLLTWRKVNSVGYDIRPDIVRMKSLINEYLSKRASYSHMMIERITSFLTKFISEDKFCITTPADETTNIDDLNLNGFSDYNVNILIRIRDDYQMKLAFDAQNERWQIDDKVPFYDDVQIRDIITKLMTNSKED